MLCAAGYILRRSLRRRETQLTEEDERTPWDKAIQGLDEIEGQDLPAAGDYRQHYTLVSQVVRSYMGIICFPDDGRTEAPGLTTEELEAGLRNSTLEPSIERLVIDLLEDADSVKFANHIPTSAEAQETLRRARFIVETTATIHEERSDTEQIRAAEGYLSECLAPRLSVDAIAAPSRGGTISVALSVEESHGAGRHEILRHPPD